MSFAIDDFPPGTIRSPKGVRVDATGPDGVQRHWFNTGDLGRCDEDGFFWLTGRKKELIIRGGHNIDPKTIEEALAAHPAVALVAAVGRPDPYAGEVPVAYAQLREGEVLGEAKSAGATLTRLQVEQDPKLGIIARYTLEDPGGAEAEKLVAALGLYTFKSRADLPDR